MPTKGGTTLELLLHYRLSLDFGFIGKENGRSLRILFSASIQRWVFTYSFSKQNTRSLVAATSCGSPSDLCVDIEGRPEDFSE